MYKQRIAAVLSMLPVALFGQAPNHAIATYDRVRDTTTVVFDRVRFGATMAYGSGISAQPLGLIVSYRVAGQTATIPDTVDFRFVFTGRALPGRIGAWEYKNNRTMALLVDGKSRFSSTAAHYDTAVVAGLGIENIIFHIPRRVVAEMLQSHSIEGVLGDSTQLVFKPQDIADLRGLQTPSNH